MLKSVKVRDYMTPRTGDLQRAHGSVSKAIDVLLTHRISGSAV